MSENTKDPLIIAGRKFGSRLLVGTGKFSSAELMRKADQALYQAKENGRDRVVIAEPNNGMSAVGAITLRR